ncbi:hypothetical protein MKA46_19815, partial [[Clostridium] innocuum]|nr:hypothetical protein [[Clostridium] innocuum]
FSFLIKLLYIIHQKTPRTVKKKTEAPQVDVEGLSFPSYFRYSENGGMLNFSFFYAFFYVFIRYFPVYSQLECVKDITVKVSCRDSCRRLWMLV